VVYVDDYLIFAKNASTIDALITDFSKGYLLQDEGDVSAFLGIQITRDTNTKTMTFTQPNLIQQIAANLGMQDNSMVKAPQRTLCFMLIFQVMTGRKIGTTDW
jgi:hypothetical protein